MTPVSALFEPEFTARLSLIFEERISFNRVASTRMAFFDAQGTLLSTGSAACIV